MTTRKIKQTAKAVVKPAFTRLKELTEEKRAEVLAILESHTYKEAAPIVAKVVGFPCSINVLFKFRSWQSTEQELARSTDLVEQIEMFLHQRQGDWSVERIQEAAISFLMMQSLSKGDVKGFATITRLPARLKQVQLKEERLELDRERFAESKKSKVDAGCEELRQKFWGNLNAWKYYVSAWDVLNGKQPDYVLKDREREKRDQEALEKQRELAEKKYYVTRVVHRRKCGCVCRTCHPEDGPYPYWEALRDAGETKRLGRVEFWRGNTRVNVETEECKCECAEHPTSNIQQPTSKANAELNFTAETLRRGDMNGTGFTEGNEGNKKMNGSSGTNGTDGNGQEAAVRQVRFRIEAEDLQRRAKLLFGS